MFAQPAQATDGVYGGGSTLASLVARQVGDCYLRTIVTGDGYSFSGSFNSATPTPGLLPTTCTTHSVLELYAGVGSGAGLRGFVSNDPQQFFRGSVNTGTAAQTVQLPADPPKFLESAGPAPFDSYPYPRVDFGAGDSPLPSNLVTTSGTYGTYTYNATPAANWQSAGSITVTRANTTSTVAYSAASFGQPIQLPLFEAPVAVAVNLPEVNQATGSTTYSVGGTTVTWTINSQFSITAPGGRIQLSSAQVCAIFSGLVTNWDDTTTLIPRLKNDGTIAQQRFYTSNTYHAASTAGSPGTGGVAYVAKSDGTHLPITIVYRSDSSGTSYIFTNYLKTVCPLFDPSNTYGYQSVFGSTSSLPNNNFSQLISNAAAIGRTLNTVGASGSDALAAAVGQSSANYGRIGYLSNDFVAPYNPVTTTRPHAASLQNDYLRANAVYHPGQSIGGVATDFVAPTPASADAAWTALSTYGVTPSTSWAYNDYNIYAKAFPATTYLVGSGSTVNITGLSILPLANGASAYPAVGTAYGYVYSCYGTGRDGVAASTRVTNLQQFLNWYYTDAQSQSIVANNGFHALPAAWTTNIYNEYLGGTSNSNSITAYNVLNVVRGCTGVTGGAQ
jgi:ABC-type phosphate transport system substrate-binding protein